MTDPKPTNFEAALSGMSTPELYEGDRAIIDRLRSEPMSQFERNTLGMERAAMERRMLGRESDPTQLLGYLIAQGMYDIPKSAYFASEPGGTTSNLLEAISRKILPATPFNRKTTSPPNTWDNWSNLIGGFMERRQK